LADPRLVTRLRTTETRPGATLPPGPPCDRTTLRAVLTIKATYFQNVVLIKLIWERNPLHARAQKT